MDGDLGYEADWFVDVGIYGDNVKNAPVISDKQCRFVFRDVFEATDSHGAPGRAGQKAEYPLDHFPCGPLAFFRILSADGGQDGHDRKGDNQVEYSNDDQQ